MTINASVADTRDEALRLLLPNLQMMARLRTGRTLGPLDIVEDAEAAQLSAQEQLIVDSGLARTVVGDPAEAAEAIRSVAAQFDVDEVMVAPVASAFRGTDARTAPGRELTLELLAKELL